MQGHVGNLRKLREKFPPAMVFMQFTDCTQNSNYNGTGGEFRQIDQGYTHLYIIHRVGSSTTAGSDDELAISLNTPTGGTLHSGCRKEGLGAALAVIQATAAGSCGSIQRTRANTGFSTQTSPLIIFIPFYTEQNMDKTLFAYNFLRTNTATNGTRFHAQVGIVATSAPVTDIFMSGSNTSGYADWTLYGMP